MPKKEREKKKEQRPLEEYDKFDLGNAISAHECTGLITVPPQTDGEKESYMAIFDYGAPDALEEEYK
ncbi:MAG: hypothetical protein IJO50_03190 [Clostridia bacterium]|nr:hypothetical protein [Clostridia bacterium]